MNESEAGYMWEELQRKSMVNGNQWKTILPYFSSIHGSVMTILKTNQIVSQVSKTQSFYHPASVHGVWRYIKKWFKKNSRRNILVKLGIDGQLRNKVTINKLDTYPTEFTSQHQSITMRKKMCTENRRTRYKNAS